MRGVEEVANPPRASSRRDLWRGGDSQFERYIQSYFLHCLLPILAADEKREYAHEIFAKTEKPWQTREGIFKDYVLTLPSTDLKMSLCGKETLLQWFRKQHEKFASSACGRRSNTYHANAFIDFMLQANEAEREWAKSVFFKDADTRSWMFGDDFVMLLDDQVRPALDVDRQGRSANPHSREVASRYLDKYPWTLRDDDSAQRLSVDALIYIYDYLRDPLDMRHFMMVSRAWHHAGVEYRGYRRKMDTLAAATGVEQLPFAFICQPHRRFFALCFVSCETDEALERALTKRQHIKAHPFFPEYCYALSAFQVKRRAAKVWCGEYSLLVNDEMVLASGSKGSKFLRIKDRVREILE